MGVDSLGFVSHQSEIYDFEMKCRDNCYVFFIMGVVLDHNWGCYANHSPHKNCQRLPHDIQGWVNHAIFMWGGTKCVMGMIIIASYFHAQKGPQLGAYDGAMFMVYQLYRWVYPWPFYWLLGADSHPRGRFCHPRWFLVCLLYGRLIIAGIHTLQRHLPFSHRPLARVLLHLIIGALLVVSVVWRDFMNSPFFDMCNRHYHSEAWCTFSQLFFYEKFECAPDFDLLKGGCMVVWPMLCAYLAVYLFWFTYAIPLCTILRRRWALIPREEAERLRRFLTVAFIGIYLGVSSHYKGHFFDTPYFVRQMPDMPFFVIDKYTFGQLFDIFLYNVLALMAIFVGLSVPFHLQKMGASTIGFYVCQFAYISIVRSPDAMKNTLLYTQTFWGNGVITGTLQLAMIAFYQVGAWYIFGDVLTQYVMLPFRLFQSRGDILNYCIRVVQSPLGR